MFKQSGTGICWLFGRKVHVSLLTLQDNLLCEPGSSIGESCKSPLKRRCCTVQTHLDRGSVGWSDLSDEQCSGPRNRVTPRDPVANGPSKRKLCWRVVPFRDIGQVVQSKGRTCVRFDRMGYRPSNGRHGLHLWFQLSLLTNSADAGVGPIPISAV